MQVEIANFVCSTEEKKSFSLQFSTIVCAHEEWQRFQQFLNIPKEFLFPILDNFFHYLLLNSLQKLE